MIHAAPTLCGRRICFLVVFGLSTKQGLRMRSIGFFIFINIFISPILPFKNIQWIGNIVLQVIEQHDLVVNTLK